MLLLFLFITTLIITFVIDQPSVDSIIEGLQELNVSGLFEWLLLPVALIIVTSLAYLLITKLNHWLSTPEVKLVGKSRNV